VVRRQRHRPRADLQHQRAEPLAVERANAGHALERDDAHGPQVGAEVDAAVPLCLLRAHVVRRAEQSPRAGLRRAVTEAAADGLGDAEVEDLDQLLVVVPNDEDVVRLQVAMNEAGFVGLAHGPRDVPQDAGGLGGGEPAHPLQALRQALALQELHDDVRRPVHDAEVEGLDHVGALERSGCACLLHEALEDALVVRGLRIDELDRDLGVQRQMLGAPHLAHAAPTDQVQQPIASGNLVSRSPGRHAVLARVVRSLETIPPSA
jgi:hypothetical protein